MTDPSKPRPFPQSLPYGSAEGISATDRLDMLVRFLFGASVPEVHHFEAGDVLIAEGESMCRPALLVIDGEIEECIGSYSQDTGPGEHTVHVARTGDLADVQAIVEPYCNEPAQCSVHAMTDGSCYPVWRAHVARRPELDAVLSVVHQGFAEAIERQRSLAVDCEELSVRLRELEGDKNSSDKMSVSSVLDEWEQSDREELKRELERLQEELDRAQLTAWEAKERQQELQKALDLERRARAALEQRAVEMMRQLAGQPEPEPDEKFPSAIRILESAELEEMEAEAKRHRDMAENYVHRARLLHRAFERLAADNPGLMIKPDVMQLMMGEEPSDADPSAAPSNQPPSEPEASSTRRNTVPFEGSSDRPSGHEVHIPASGRVPQIDEPLTPEDLLDDESDPEPSGPGTGSGS